MAPPPRELPDLPVENTNLAAFLPLPSPLTVKAELPAPASVLELVLTARQEIRDAIFGRDTRRTLVVVGPCSIHDPEAAVEYAARLAKVREATRDRLIVIMRAYFEKPRTTVGWKGLINDPHLDGSCDIATGLRRARQTLLSINALGVPCGSEMLDPITPQYVADLSSWASIGARTTESQTHREMASGLSMPIGFKNGTDGSLRIAVDAIKAAAARHHFISVTKSGHVGVFSTTGNEDAHVILRGGKTPNYDAASVNHACAELAAAGLRQQLMIDFSHANSSKQYQRQLEVGADVAAQVAAGDARIIGAMIESHLNPGRQDLIPGQPLEYAKSITDACIGWDDTEPLLRLLADAVKKRRLTAPADEE